MLPEEVTHRIAGLLDIGTYMSVESLVSQLGCTESGLRVFLEAMRKEGYEIEENPELVIRLLTEPDVLSENAIKSRLQTRIMGRKVRFWTVLDSTNEKAKALGRQGEGEGMVVVADEQTQGRGRFGRGWSSPGGRGIWMSVIMRPDPSLEPLTALSLIVAYSVAMALREMTGVRAEIKWPNDVRIGTKKVCGILSELDRDSTESRFLVMGIGVNVNQFGFEEELATVATSIRMETGKLHSRLPLIRKILENLEDSYVRTMRDGFSEVLKDVRKLCMLVGERVSVNIGSEIVKGYAQDIDDAGRLIVRTDDGKVREILAGEASTVR
jgi:BirA family biotin operon repressor/biotin-[acetyl-CoA-carboxylase] ligase